MILRAPKSECWIVGDVTAAHMANVFIGNPASTFSAFIRQSRNAFGFGNNYVYMTRDYQGGRWRTACDDSCLFGGVTGNRGNDEFQFNQWMKMAGERYAGSL